MNIIKTEFEGLIIIEPNVIKDNRGYFMESYNKKALEDLDLSFDFIQDNQSQSSYGVIRGLHFQNPPNAQTKLIRALSGTILDVVVDIRKDSKTYGKHFDIELSAENKKQLIVPKGFAHGFSVLSESAEILYKCDNYYNRQSEGGVMYNDPLFNIDWGVPADKVILSEKDQKYAPFSTFKSNF